MSANIVFEHPTANVAVARFARPNVREVLYRLDECDDIGETALFRELRDGGIAGLPDGGALVLDVGPVEAFSSAFYGLLLRARADLKAKNCRLLLCGFSQLAAEAFTIMGGAKTFEVFPTEREAVAEAAK